METLSWVSGPGSRVSVWLCAALKECMDKATPRTEGLESRLRVKIITLALCGGWSLTSRAPHPHEPDFSSLLYKSLIYSLHRSQRGLISCVRAGTSAPALAPCTGRTWLWRYTLMRTCVCTDTRLVQVHAELRNDCSRALKEADSGVMKAAEW